MTKEVQQFEKSDVSVDGSDTYLEKVGKDCNELMVKLHAIGELKDELLLPITRMKCKNNAYRKVNGASAKYFSLQHTSVRLRAFQDTQANFGEFVER